MNRVIYFVSILFTSLNLYGIDVKNWEASLYVYEGTSQNRLQAGVRDGATDGYDLIWDSPALLSPDGFNSFFYHPEWNSPSPFFWRDIKAFDGIKVWEFTVNSANGANIIILWDLTYVPAGEISLKLIDLDNPEVKIDMQMNNNYSFTSTGVKKFNLIATTVNHSPSEATSVSEITPSTPQEGSVIINSPRQTILTGPPAPSNITINPGNGARVIRWDKVNEAVSYNVYRSVDAIKFFQINSSPVLKEMYVDPNSEKGNFYYCVSSVDVKGFESRCGE